MTMTKRNLTKIIRLALPDARIDWSQGDLSLLGEGPIVTKSLGRCRLKISFQMQVTNDGMRVSARILADGGYVFHEFGDVLFVSESELCERPHAAAANIAVRLRGRINELGTEIGLLAAQFSSNPWES